MPGLGRAPVRWLDEWWAEWLGCPPERLRAGGVVVNEERERVELVRFRAGTGVLVAGPRRCVAGLGVLPDDLDRAVLSVQDQLAGARTGGVAWYGYLTATDPRPSVPVPEGTEVRRLGPADEPALQALRAATDPDQWAESGAESGTDVGCFAGPELTAVASAGGWRGFGSIGVLTAAPHRGRGHGRAVVAAAVEAALHTRPAVQYRAWVTDHASIATGRAAGFHHELTGAIVEWD
jgi:GNAT superfamily N-acetyltransferase